ncbi:uncharacterized protein LOC115023894 [Cottoperca gobio]|uniref:Uncharacterized protein LOC115023894 n=1 Tax=Cottoperca gobio TaxID=56716 RepID=A0A6J2RJJ5_COTGO|nr:uncharacterized protein LOC115023894 [Cottoperca gobio]
MKGEVKRSPSSLRLCCNSVAMKLQILLILIFNVFTVALVQSLSEVIGYIGENVTLTSRADPSWNLSSIDWLIFSNHWIATYRSGKTNINWVDRYNERLTLNISSGDLTIHDLNTEDATLYTVEFNTKSKNIVQKTELIVMKRLQEPTIHTVRYSRGKDGCWFQLHCSSTDKGVDLSWQGLSPQGNCFRPLHIYQRHRHPCGIHLHIQQEHGEGLERFHSKVWRCCSRSEI